MDKDSKARDIEMSDGILRQRRNLIGISFLLPIYLFGDISLDKISVLGNVFTVQNPQVIKYSLLFLFLYFFIRYFQYFIEENHVRLFREKMDRRIRRNLELFLKRRIKSEMGNLDKMKFVSIILPAEYTIGVRPVITAGFPEQLIPNKNYFKRNFLAVIRVFDSKAGSGEPDEEVKKLLEAYRENSYWEQSSRTTNQEVLPEMFQKEIKFNWFELEFIKLREWLQSLIYTTSITNYYLPLVIASLSSFLIIYWVISRHL